MLNRYGFKTEHARTHACTHTHEENSKTSVHRERFNPSKQHVISIFKHIDFGLHTLTLIHSNLREKGRTSTKRKRQEKERERDVQQ